MTSPARTGSLTAAQSGVVCATAGRLQRDMRERAAAYPALFDAKPFDAALYSTVSLAMAFSGPLMPARELGTACRVTLWCFGLDWLVDYVATSREEVDDVVRRCLPVAEGGPPVPGDDLTRFLADLRDDLAGAPAFAGLREVWLDELRRMLAGMTREWEWKTASAKPSLDEYLANADNLGFSFVLASHWIATGEPPGDEVARVREASWAVQRVIRLLNDVASYERDLSWGDLNALMLVSREDLERRLTTLAAEARELLGPLREDQPRLADYMERQMDFCAGFYQVTDYWGTL
ncbi:hypothetical protein Misp01_75280 [Microtetraspora sp. NBRC 13810]|uniref:terpene synthase family protein n=1 Tax=Microtetraspora sp. NBRC 13810 TaxID=3030990 RepID=UPI0024A4E516|nr:terpene synthase family protein [Microtetraspora sp. NBRC 13810]GLW12400.1 hypothetical protein Misp01_75280 [Microtetraspora sp. NBRC 13810]